MDIQVHKVYVALGKDLQDGYMTLDWTLKKWSSHPISVVIVHVNDDTSKDFVYTPFGKLPASAVSDEKLEVLKFYEQEKIDKLLSKYITFCGKVKAEILKVEKNGEPLHKLMIDLISRLRITKLVMDITFMKSSSRRSSNGAISGLFKVHQHKPNFCELYILCGGKLVLLRGENEDGFIKDDKEVMVMREKAKSTSWIGKIFRNSPGSLASSYMNSQNLWDNCVQDIENYFQHLLSLNLDEEKFEEETDILETGSMEPDVPQHADSNMHEVERMDGIKIKLEEARMTIRLRRDEVKAHAERYEKAQWAFCLCSPQIEELETRIKEESTTRMELKKELDAAKERAHEIETDVAESKKRLITLVQLQSELSNKLQLSTMAKSGAEAQLEKALITRVEMVREIEELRRQRDVLHRRIEFCKEKDAIGMVSRLDDSSCGCREYSVEDVKLATNDFSERLRVKSGGDWTNVYRGRINHATVAVKMFNSVHGLSHDAFHAKVKLHHDIRHPHLIAMVGFCSRLKCILFEYMHSGSLRDILYPTQSSTKRIRTLRWHNRIRIAHEICSGLAYLHLAEPRPIVHGSLTLSHILLDRNLVAKIGGFGLNQFHDQSHVRLDIRAFGVLLLHLLAGRNWARLVDKSAEMDRMALVKVLEEMAVQWPLDFAEEFAGIAIRCLPINQGPNTDLRITQVLEELDEIKKKADELARGGCEVANDPPIDGEYSSEVPSVFLCPIFQEVMKNPHVAADGFSYELEAIEEWLEMGHDTSPMTNLRLKHKFLTPNLTLRSLIQDWHNKRSIPS
ncbi:U-box domain-containing protein/Pkinase_Tyr domain-containing protein [Cephalotus follicularis]|uniref:RING-type E3 ubiquitin transferase n=1 Tax=Cephalotus follicularis TaxID=3775 RepID=A0A1Q3BPX1_CEPFO|nr:U-box domain-containing protein/Pkinase_Tyr domain-containing protein [Cephalotus follicularis]